MKKLICFILAAGLSVLSLAACDKNGASENESKSVNESESSSENETIKDDVAEGSFSYSDLRYSDRVITVSDFTVNENVAESSGENLSVNTLFTSNMVLQRGTVNCLFGYTSNSKIAVKLKDVYYYGKITNGRWEVYLPVLEADNIPFTVTIFNESSKISLNNVCIGEVYICAGQSNMETTLGMYEEHQQDVMSANDSLLRLYKVAKVTMNSTYKSAIDEYTVPTLWQITSPVSAANFSATGYLYGKRLREKLNMPIGLIDTAVGGSQIAYWLPAETYKTLTENGAELYSGDKQQMFDCNGYNQMINPLRFYNVRGVVWYQGETDAMGIHSGYETALTSLINDYRKVFDNQDLIWTVIELPRFGGCTVGYGDIRTCQQNVAEKLNGVCMSVSIDLGDWYNIHPGNKTVIARRAADETLFDFYGISSDRSPKVVKAEQISDTQIKITFNNVGSGLSVLNDGAGFQFATSFNENINLGYKITLCEDKRSVIAEYVSKYKLFYAEYGVNPLAEDISYFDVSKQLCIYNSEGMPADQFIIDLGM